MKNDALGLRDNAKHQLEKIKTIESGIDYLNKVKAIELWAKAEKKDAELQNMIAEQKIRTQRILGNLITEGQEKGEIRKQSDNQHSASNGRQLATFGITRNESSTFQKVAAIPEDVFENEILLAKKESEERVELTTGRLLRAAEKHFNQTRPFRMRVSTYIQGTLLTWFLDYTKNDEVKIAEYIRGLIKADMKLKYEPKPKVRSHSQL